MNKTPEEIKKGLEYLSITNVAEKVKKAKRGLPYAYTEEVAADALALIQRLEAQNAELLQKAKQFEAKVPRWISVEERLPEYCVHVLAYRRHRHSPEDGFREIRIILRSEEYGMADRTNHYEVTHWMPLPEPPEV